MNADTTERQVFLVGGGIARWRRPTRDTRARAAYLSLVPALAGQHYVQAPVIDFTAGLSDEDQKGIADYLSRLKLTEHASAIATIER